MEFMLERRGSIGPSCYALSIRCIINGSFCMYNFGTP